MRELKFKDMGFLEIPEQSFDSYIEIEHLLRYVTRTNGSNAEDLVGTGCRGVQLSRGIETAISQFKQVQGAYDKGFKKSKRHCFHEVFAFSPEISGLLADELVMDMAREMSLFYWDNGFQVVYGAHQTEDGKYHIHFALNAVNIRTGKKWHTDFYDTQERTQLFREIVWENLEG